MRLALTVYYDDGSSGIVEIEKPAGAQPDSILAIVEGLLEAEKGGKTVSRIGRSNVNPFSTPGSALVIDNSLVTRAAALETLRRSCNPMPERYQPLFR